MSVKQLFHEGELQVQTLAKESEIAQRNAAVVSQHIIQGALPFIAQQMMVVVSSISESGQIWTSILFGEPGFIQAPDDKTVLINPAQMIKQSSDPLWRNIALNSEVGLLIIELSTRRRLRVNGNINKRPDGQFTISVAQSYPNCPKYIQRRQPSLSEKALTYETPLPKTGTTFTQEQETLIANADSFFVGSGVIGHHNDASYRGGEPGFVNILSSHQLVIPDYKGNSMFNTLGNFQSNPHAGLVFIDFENSKLVQMTGKAKVLWDQQDDINQTGGTKRYWQFDLTNWQETTLPKEIHWSFFDYSPHNPKAETIKNVALKVVKTEQLSERIKLFRFTDKNGGLLPAFEPGAHLPIEIQLPAEKIKRHYSIISSSDDNRFYEIAVQQEKQGSGGSNYLHEHLNVGDEINSSPPKNEFSLTSKGKHHVLIAGGIGITPILSLLRDLSERKESFELHYSVKHEKDVVFAKEIWHLAGDKAHFYITQGENAQRLDIHSLLAEKNKQNHIYMCGPTGLLTEIKDQAEQKGWQETHLHYESFGAAIQSTNKAIEVKLKKSGKVIVIDPKETILEGLLAAKVSVPFECKRGECGMCSTEYVDGTPEHRDVYLSQDEKKQNLCVCVSRAKSDVLTLNL